MISKRPCVDCGSIIPDECFPNDANFSHCSKDRKRGIGKHNRVTGESNEPELCYFFCSTTRDMGFIGPVSLVFALFGYCIGFKPKST
jgi:hypothetical protein